MSRVTKDVQTHWVRPCQPQGSSGDQVWPISDFDYIQPAVNIPLVAIYALPSDANGPSVIEDLRVGLAETLGQYRQFGGRLQINDETGQHTIKTTDNDVVELSVQYHDGPDDDYVPSYAALEKDAFPPMLLDSKKLLPRIMTEKQNLTQHGDFHEDDTPVTMFMVTFIRGGLVIGVGLHHLATDVSGLDGFLESWAANTKRNTGDPDEGVEMVVCLEDSAMQKLLEDQEWLNYAVAKGPRSC